MKKSGKKKILLITAAAAGLVWAYNKITILRAVSKNKLPVDIGDYFEWKVGKIFYTKRGQGKPLLLVHDLDVFSSDYEWHKVIDDLSKQYTVYTLDLIGCGRSDKPEITYTNYLFVQLISDFIKNIIGDKTSVVATGLSTSFVTMARYQEKELFDKVIYVNPSSVSVIDTLPSRSFSFVKRLFELPLLGTLIYNLKINRKVIMDMFQSIYFSDNSKIKSKYVDVYNEAAHTKNANGRYLMASLTSSFVNVDISKALLESSNGIFILFGDKLDSVEDSMDEYMENAPFADMKTMQNAKYLPQMENPEQFAEEIITRIN